MSDKYRIKSSTIALFQENGRHVTRTIPEGAVVEIGSLEFDRNKLVEVIWDGKKVMMFCQDIQCRGERVQ
jgi:predicted lipoprotein